MARLNSLVHFYCASPDHRAEARANGAPITIHEGRWAYCAGGSHEGHEWQPTGGLEYHELVIRFHRSHDAAVREQNGSERIANTTR